MQRAVVWVQEERGEGTGLGRSVPAIRAVDKDAGAILEGLERERGGRRERGGGGGKGRGREREGERERERGERYPGGEEGGLKDELDVPQPARGLQTGQET